VPPGLVDTNVFIHAISNDAHSDECAAFLEALERGEVEARLDALVLHELSYALSHYRRDLSRDDVADYLVTVVALDGIVAEKALLVDAITRWRAGGRLAFVDAYLAAVAARDGVPVYTKNSRELRAQGVEVPEPLPS
jgi:predicted nucleic acid-binding protein